LNRELDEQCARALGWTHGTHPRSDGTRYSCELWHNANDECTWEPVEDSYEFGLAWSPSTRLDSARLLEDDIEARGLQERYTYELERIVLSRDYWEYIRAKPEDRALAYLRARGLQ